MPDRIIETCGLPLIKFHCRDKIEQLQAGKVYMKSLGWYRENARISDAIGDDYEAMLHIHSGFMIVLSPAGNQGLHPLDDTNLQTIYKDDFVFCMFCFDPQRHQFTEEQKEKMLSFGDTALVIKNKAEFHDRIKAALQKEEIPSSSAYCGKVVYYDETKDQVSICKSLLADMHNVAFLKRKQYSYQQEYRFLLPYDGREEDHLELQIGSIEDISEIVSAKGLLNAKVIC